MSTTVHTQGTGSTPPAHQAKPKAHDKPAHDTAPADLFASLLALVGQAPAAADTAIDAAADGASDLSQDTTSQNGSGGTDKRGASLPLSSGPLSLTSNALSLNSNPAPGNTPAVALAATFTGHPAQARLTLEGFTAVEGRETLPTQALETGPTINAETGKRTGPAPAFAWRNAPGAAQAAQATATQFGNAPAAMSWQRVQSLAPDSTLSAPGGLTAPRATVALDERFAPQLLRTTDSTIGPSHGAVAGLDDGNADAPAGLLPSGGAARQGGDGLGTSAPGTVVAGAGEAAGLGGSGDGGASQGQASPDQPDAQHPATQADEPTEIGHWGTGALRHASLRVGEDAATAIDIQLKVQGQQVDVNFTTDNAETRDALREQATTALSELLQQSGLGLGGVSVGGQGQSRDPSREQAPGPSTVQLGQARRAGQEAEGAAPARPRTDGNRPLDVFA